jgi:hypothetical protein
MSGLFTIIIFFFVIALTAVVFVGWLAFVVVRLIVGGITSLILPAPAARVDRRVNGMTGPGMQPQVSAAVRCPTRGCFAMNPPAAHFCRRCGRGLPAAQRVQVRRAAVW